MTGQEMRCCICIWLDLDEMPEGYLIDPLTIINGNLVCKSHAVFAGPNEAMGAWANNEYAHGREPRGGGPA